MKKSIRLVLIVCLAALLIAALVACDPSPENPLGPEAPTISSYTVTFDVNGAEYTFESLKNPITGVKYGDTIPAPKDEKGNDVVLFKTGYTFTGWSVNNTDFEFGKTQIVGNTTIKAKFEANKYYHILDIYGGVSYGEDGYTIDQNKHASLDVNMQPIPSDNVLKYSNGNNYLDDAGKTVAVPETDVSLPSSAIGADTNLYSTYNSTAPTRVAVPTRPVVDGAPQDNFCFWYYMADDLNEQGEPIMGDDGKVKRHPVQFTDWAAKGADTVAVRSVTYSYTQPLRLYAMFESDLPLVTVQYFENEEATAPLDDTHTYRLGLNIDKQDMLSPEREGYGFDHWYFVYETEGEQEGETVRNVSEFVFDSFDSNGNSTVKDATSPMDAAHADDIPAGEQNFRPVTLKLYAFWVKKIEINSAAELNALRDKITACYGDDTKQEELEEYLNAQIAINADLDFSSLGETEPLFDAEHPFVGVIDGGSYSENEDGEKVLDKTATISGVNVTGSDGASLFGYVNGTVKNLNVIGNFKATATDAPLYLGAIASVAEGQFENCTATATFSIPENALFACIGGVVGKLNGVANDDKGTLKNCLANVTIETASARGLTIGGIAGEAGSSTKLENATATLNVTSASALGEQASYSGLRIGGVVGNSVAAITACTATVNVASITANGSAMLGGLTGQNAGSVARCYAQFELGGAQNDAVKVGSKAALQTVAIGGLIGLNEGDIINSYAIADLKSICVVNAQTVAVGGLVGSNSSALSDSSSNQEAGVGAINRCYAKGTLSVTVQAEGTELYVGGMAGVSRHSKFAKNFSLVNINVSYTTADTKHIHAGFLFGALTNNAVFTSGYYANENRITINGTEYAPKAEQAPEEAESAADEEFDVYRIGTPRDAADFENKDVVFGATSDKETNLGWIGGLESGTNIWQLTEDGQGGTLLTLVDVGYKE